MRIRIQTVLAIEEPLLGSQCHFQSMRQVSLPHGGLEGSQISVCGHPIIGPRHNGLHELSVIDEVSGLALHINVYGLYKETRGAAPALA